ncbi:hypothetical protein KQI84_18310 [bacterium]|nr:hypothetical protein [bacterium]
MRRNGALQSLGLFMLLGTAASAASVTLVYDDTFREQPLDRVYYAANFDPETGRFASGWNDYKRYPLYDDGTHGDATAGDHVWSIAVNLPMGKGHLYEWACDTNADPGDGWVGPGKSFKIESPGEQTIYFAPVLEEAGMTPQEFATKYNISLNTAAAPQPIDDGKAFLFTYHKPDAERVFLAGSFNSWGNNRDGVVDDPAFRMFPGPNDVWYRKIDLSPGVIRYKFVAEDSSGDAEWFADPSVNTRDVDENTVLDLRSLLPDRYVRTVPGRELNPTKIPAFDRPMTGPRISSVELEKTWIKPGEKNQLLVRFGELPSDGCNARLVISNDLVTTLSTTIPIAQNELIVPLSTPDREGPLGLEVLLDQNNKILDRDYIVLPVVQDIPDDLRYGFYANWNRISDNYAKKADMLAKLFINGVEFYDYFPAHGDYAPTEEVYEFEPFFGNKVYAKDIQGKIDAGHQRGILSIAYVAAYAASKSVYEAHPYPMTTPGGEPRIFNGRITTVPEAKAAGEPVWFWLMAIADDTPWHDYIIKELRRTLDKSPDDLVSFDGFEVDSYGHPANERYYSEGSKHSGRLLSEIIAEFIEDVYEMSHAVKSDAAVSFNCVCEFGIEKMYHITDFIFIENWAGCKGGLEDTVDICYRHRAPAGQRVVLKMYPPDAGFTDPPYWPADSLRLMMGICMTGGGSLMVVGEPDELNHQMHALNSLYYPDNVAIPLQNVQIVRDYNMFDALLFGRNHGRNVANYETTSYMPGTVVRGFQNDRGEITVTLLNNGEQMTWNAPRPDVKPLTNEEIAINLPANATVTQVLYGSPDDPAMMQPFPVDFEQTDGFVRLLIPRLHTFGAVIIKYQP